MENQQTNQDPVTSIPANSTPADQPDSVSTPETPVAEPEISVFEPTISKSEIPVSPLRPKVPVEPTSTPNQYQPVLDQYSANSQQPSTFEDNSASTPKTQTDYFSSPALRQSSNLPKIIFIFALIIFVLVFAALASVFYKSQSASNQNNSETSQENATPTPSFTCSLNDKTYKPNESFPASDGCNTCTCQSQDVIDCTENTCMSTKSATKSKTTTPTATPSAAKN